MADLLFIATALVFFAIAAAYVRACDRLIGPDQPTAASDTAPAEAQSRVGSAR